MPSKLVRLTADGNVGTGPQYLKSIVLQGGTTNTRIEISDATGAPGTTLMAMLALANDMTTWTAGDARGVYFQTGLFVDFISGATPSASFEIE